MQVAVPRYFFEGSIELCTFSVLTFIFWFISLFLNQLTMITGDNPLTACHVARELRLTRREIVVLSPPESSNNHGIVYWVSFALVEVSTMFRSLMTIVSVFLSSYSWKRVALAASGSLFQSSHYSIRRYQRVDVQIRSVCHRRGNLLLCTSLLCFLRLEFYGSCNSFCSFILQAFSYLQSTEKLSKFFHAIVQNIQVFARVAPKQKVT